MNKDSAISKINSIGKAGSIISRIALVFLAIGVVIGVLAGIFFVSVPKEDFVIQFDDNATLTLNTGSKALSRFFGNNNEDVSAEVAQGSMAINGNEYSFVDTDYDADTKIVTYSLKGNGTTVTAIRFAVVAWISAAFAAINIVLFIYVKKLCDALKVCRSPFEDSIITGLQHCAWVLIPWAVFGSFFQSVLSTVFTSNIKTGFDLNVPTILVILLLFGLAYVFKYGAVLQTESDETL